MPLTRRGRALAVVLVTALLMALLVTGQARAASVSTYVGFAPTPDGSGYWLVTAAGDVSAHGTAASFGAMTGHKLNKPIVGMASTPTGAGYWLVASDGGIFAFGDARFFGSTGAIKLNKPIVAMASTATGAGYWLVASDGGIFAYGDARFLGSMGGHALNKPIVGMTSTPSGLGYWLVASDGGIFAYGDAQFFGSTGSEKLAAPIIGIAATPTGLGYWMLGQDGGVFSFGDAQFRGSGAGVFKADAIALIADDTGGYTLVAQDGTVISDPNTSSSTTTMPPTTTTTIAVNPADEFVTRSGSSLMLDGQTFKFAGTNEYWMGVLDSSSEVYPSQYEINDGLESAQQMGANVIRSHTMGTSTGCAQCIEPSLNHFNDAGFTATDYAIYRAHQLGIRFIIPLTDENAGFHGSVTNFLSWRGSLTTSDFYTNPTIVADYEAYISHYLNHVNPYTGLALKDDPTILAWETGNELWSAPTTWTESIASYIKGIDPNHLVADGHLGTTSGQLANADVDMYTDHFYPVQTGILNTDAAASAAANKVYYIGEYDSLVEPTAAGTLAHDTSVFEDGAASIRADVTTAAPNIPWTLQLVQGNMSLAAGTATVTFWAKSSTPHVMHVYLGSTHQQASLTSSWAQYSMAFNFASPVTAAKLNFDLAEAVGSTWIDNVSVTNNGGSNLLTNASFETTGSNWLSPWTLYSAAPTSMSTFLSAIESNRVVAGDLVWETMAHTDLGGYRTGDAYALEYPGTDSTMQGQVQKLRNHAYAMRGLSVPATAVPTVPVALVTKSGASAAVTWRGSVGGATYEVQRSTDQTMWTSLGTAFTDLAPTYADTPAAGHTYYYRVQATNLVGGQSAWSPAVSVAL